MNTYTINGHAVTIRRADIAERSGYIVSADGRDLWIFATIKAGRAFAEYWFR